MKLYEKVLASVVGFVGVALTLFLLHEIYNHYYPTPKYAAGDCFSVVYSAGEFKPREVSDLFNKVIKVGRKSYLTEKYFLSDDGKVYGPKKELNEENINIIDKITTRVNCNTGLEVAHE